MASRNPLHTESWASKLASKEEKSLATWQISPSLVGSLFCVTKGHSSYQNQQNYISQAIKLENEAWHLEEIEPAMIKNESEYLAK